MPAKRWLILAGSAGILSAILYLLDIFASSGAIPSNGGVSGIALAPFSLFSVAELVLYLTYVFGFVGLGKKLHDARLQFAAYLWFASSLITGAVQIFDTTLIGTFSLMFLIPALFMTIGIIFTGWTVFRQEKHLGPIGKWYGLLAMLSGTGILFAFSPYLAFMNDIAAYILGVWIFFHESRQ